MSNNQQTPNLLQSVLMVVIALLIGGTLWYVWQSKDNTDKTLNDTKKAQTTQPTDNKTDEYKGWKSYAWTSEGVTFKYPGDWIIKDGLTAYRVYARNVDVDLNKDETPANFQQIWLSSDSDETAVAREEGIKKGESMYRQVDGAVKASTIKAGSLTVSVYEYNTVGGPTLEAYFTNKAGKRIMATTSTEVGQQNQTDMVANLKKVLATITLQ